jgi:low affinity Fe/Cu permease
MLDLIRRALTQLGVLAGQPLAFLIVFAYVAAWLVFEPETFDWHGIATIAVWIMTLFIQRAESRDTQSIQAKLDELLHAHSMASNAMTRIDEEEPEDIELCPDYFVSHFQLSNSLVAARFGRVAAIATLRDGLLRVTGY